MGRFMETSASGSTKQMWFGAMTGASRALAFLPFWWTQWNPQTKSRLRSSRRRGWASAVRSGEMGSFSPALGGMPMVASLA
jgi:hypothetical protein